MNRAIARRIGTDPTVRQVMLLLKFGVPWDEAWSMSPERRFGFLIAAQDPNADQYDWDRMAFRDQG